MFNCQECNQPIGPNVSPIKVVTKKRQKVYTNGDGDVIGFGWEIVKEEQLCENCATKHS